MPASIGLWVEKGIKKAVLMQEPFYTYLLLILIHTQYVNVRYRESFHAVSQSVDWFDPPPCWQIKVYESLTGIF